MGQIRIVGAVLTIEKLTLYKEDGTTLIINQGDHRVKPILDTIMPVIKAGGVATISDEQLNNYAGFEKKTGIKFFRVLKSAVNHIFNRDQPAEVLEPTSAGKVPGATKAQTPTDTRVESVMKQAEAKTEVKKPSPARVPTLGEGLLTPANSMSGSNSGDLRHDETIVAVVGDTVIPGVEALKGQFDHVGRGDNPEGLKRLMERLADMIHERQHSVEDILRFLERGDLPIADDGSIVAYKVLRLKDRAKGLFADCHTGKVDQRVGSYVVVDETMVDKNRRNECSNGLHIARRGYIGGFSGDVCVLAKIAPEDIITVPHGDANKVRVCGYHIIDLLEDGDFRKLKQNKPMTDTKSAKDKVARALVGDHIGKIEEVRITKQRGEGVVISPIKNGKVIKAAPVSSEHRNAAAVDDVQGQGTDPRQIAREMRSTPAKPAAVKAEKPKAAGGSVREQVAQDHYGRMTNGALSIGDRQEAARRLLLHKQKAKVGWSKLGFDSDAVADEIKATLALVEAPKKPDPAPSKAPAKKPVAKKSEPVKAAPKPQPAPKAKVEPKPEPKVESKKEPIAPLAPIKSSSRQVEAQRFYSNMIDPKRSLPARRSAAQDLKNFKSKAKVSWIALGLKGDVGDQIQKLLDGKP